MTLKEPDGQEAGERTVPAPDALTDLHPQRKEPIGYFPSDHEIAAARRLLERRARDDARSQLFFEAVPESGGKVTSKHPDVLVSQLSLMDSFSTGYVHVSDALLTQLTKISCRDHDQDVSGRALAQAVAMVQGIAPRKYVAERAACPKGRNVCHIHGGRSPGAPKGNTRALKHGHYSKDAIAARRQIAELLKSARRTLDAIP